MGNGYTRNDTSNNIADGNVINAADFDGEFDAIEAAFVETTGHTHDGTADEGAPVTVVGPVQDFVVSATEIKPKTTNTLDIGTSGLQFKDLYIDGTGYIDAVDIDGGNIDNTVIGASTAAAITGTTITAETSFVPDASDGATLGTASLEFSDLYLADGAQILFGDDQDTTLTHTDGTGLTLNSTNKLAFGDAASFIQQSSDGVLRIDGEATIDLNASTVVTVSNDLKLNSDSAVLGFGADNDTTLTHTDGTGLTLNSTNKLTFGDAASFIQQSGDGVLRVDGEATIDLNASTAVTVSNDLKLDSDSAVLGFGADNDTTLTHTDGTGLTLNSTNKLTFGDAASFIQQSGDGVLRIDGEATIDLNASTAVTVSNDLKLDSDSAVLGFGADNDTTLTHTDGTGLTLNSTNKLTFGDAASFIQQSSDGVLRIDGEATIDLNASTAVTISNDLKLDSDDAVLSFGSDSDITITHDPDDGLKFKSVATGDDNPFVLTLETGELNIEANDKLGVINFQAPNEQETGDAQKVAAGIEAVSEGDFAADSNATSLAFKTGSSDDADEKVRIDSSGRVQIGTTSATNDAFLTIKDTGSANPVARISFDRTDSAVTNGVKIGYTFAGASADFEIANRDAGLVRISTSDTERLRVESDGDVLIGHTANVWPEKLLSYQGTSENKVGVGVYATNTSYTETLVRVQSETTSTGGNYKFFEGRSTGGAIQYFVKSDGSAFFAGSIGAGTSSPSSSVDIDCRNTGVIQIVSTDTVQLVASNGGSTLKNVSNNPLLFGTNNTERMRITAAGNVGIGAQAPAARLSLGALVANKVFGLYDDGTNFYGLGIGSANYKFNKPSAAVFTFNNLDRANDTTTEIARFDTSGRLLIRKTAAGLTSPGVETHTADNSFLGTTSTGAALHVNRQDSDGTLVTFRHDNTSEGSITVSGSTVSYNGGHLSRWSQAADGNRIDGLLKGTVMTNLDKMAVWTSEDGKTKNNEQLNCMAVSSVEGDANVAGVFVNFNEDKEEELNDPYGKSCVNDMNIAMTGDMVIRIASDTTVARGDLLMSAGDGTAKPQGDDIVRSKTIAKVTSINVSHTYSDGSYLVPCVLMAC